jgi:hypothetical protein
MRDKQDNKHELCRITPADWACLRSVEIIDSYPVLIVWLIDHIKTLLLAELHDALYNAFTKRGDGKQAEENTAGAEAGSEYADTLVKENFGDPFLFLCYEYLAKIHVKPESFCQLFEFLRYSKTIGIFKEIAMKKARAADG